jgi:hypothetical protein
MRLRCARASLRSSEERSERGRLRGGPSVDVAVDEVGEGMEERRVGSTVVEGIVLGGYVGVRGGSLKEGQGVLFSWPKRLGDFGAQYRTRQRHVTKILSQYSKSDQSPLHFHVTLSHYMEYE